MKTMITVLAILVSGLTAQAQTEKISREVLKFLVSHAGQIILVDGETGSKLPQDMQLTSIIVDALTADVTQINSKDTTLAFSASAHCIKTKDKTTKTYSCIAAFNNADVMIEDGRVSNVMESSLVLTFEVVLKNNKPELKSKIIKTSLAG